SHGLTGCEYELQVRLQQMVEVPGSAVTNADIRFATNGIDVEGLPAHSPLIANTSVASGVDTTVAGGANQGTGVPAQNLGDVLTTDTSSVDAAGYLNGLTSVQWYTFNLTYSQIQAIGGFSSGAKTWSTVFDVGYADGLTRPDTEIDVYDSAGNLIYVGRDSNVADQQPQPGTGLDSTNLSHSSFGTNDPYIGPVQMEAGTPGNAQTYYVAIHSSGVLPDAIDAYIKPNATDYMVRLEPVDSINRVVEDHIGTVGGMTGQNPSTITPLFGNNSGTPGGTTNPAGNFTVANTGTKISAAGYTQLNSYATPFNLADVTMFVTTTKGSGSNNSNHLYTYNPFTGTMETDQGAMTGDLAGMNTIAMRTDGQLYGLNGEPLYPLITTNNNVQKSPNDANSGNLIQINTGTAADTQVGSGDGISTYYLPPNTTSLANANVGIQFDAMTFVQIGNNRYLYAVGHRDDGNGDGVNQVTNLFYQLDPNTGQAYNPNPYFQPPYPYAYPPPGGDNGLSTNPTIVTAPATDDPSADNYNT
ncbi:MAG: hypothetical protein ACREHD_05745, partial [Pirellulales bacterium]